MAIDSNSGTTFTCSGGTVGVEVKTNTNWVFWLEDDSGEPSWLKINGNVYRITGSESQTLTIEADFYTGSTGRGASGFCQSINEPGLTAWVGFWQLTGNTIPPQPTQSFAWIPENIPNILIEVASGDTMITHYFTTTYDANSLSSIYDFGQFIHGTQLGPVEKVVMFYFDANDTGEDRQANGYVKYNGQTVGTVTIKQYGGEAPPPPAEPVKLFYYTTDVLGFPRESVEVLIRTEYYDIMTEYVGSTISMSCIPEGSTYNYTGSIFITGTIENSHNIMCTVTSDLVIYDFPVDAAAPTLIIDWCDVPCDLKFTSNGTNWWNSSIDCELQTSGQVIRSNRFSLNIAYSVDPEADKEVHILGSRAVAIGYIEKI